MRPWPRAVLFDFDGTLADSYAAIAASVNHVRQIKGHGPLSEEEIKRRVGRGPEYLLEHLIPDVDLQTDLAAYRAHHPGIMKQLTRLLPGAAETVASLRRHGIHVGTCSNKPRIFTQQLLDFLGLGQQMSVVVGPEDVPRPKPAPDMLVAALQRLGIASSEALYVGDMSVDVATARGAGVRVWVVPTGSEDLATLTAAQPDAVLQGLGDVSRLLELT